MHRTVRLSMPCRWLLQRGQRQRVSWRSLGRQLLPDTRPLRSSPGHFSRLVGQLRVALSSHNSLEAFTGQVVRRVCARKRRQAGRAMNW